MTHQTKACKPQKTKMAVNSSSVVPRPHSWTLFYPFERRSRRYGAPHETLRAKCRHIVLKIHEKNDRKRGGSGPSVQTFLGVRHAFLPHGRLLNQKINSFPIVRKYQLEITCRLSEIQSALSKLKC